ncbi:MAG: hypothetical protein ABIJ96_00580 [Elusimicrobiota bacterium]
MKIWERWERRFIPLKDLIRLLLLLLLPFAASAASGAEAPPFELPPAPVAEPIRYRADYFEYQGSTTGANARIILRGAVEIVESSRTLRAQEATLDMSRRRAKARGGFELDDGLSVLRGEGGEFDIDDKSGIVDDVRAEFPPWRIWAQRGRLDQTRKAYFRRTLFTSCDGNPPDYHFRASGLHVKPKKWLYATNVRFHLGPVPIFYTPFMWKFLDPDKLIRTRMKFSYDRRNGGAARSTTEFQLHRSLFSRLFLDYYSETGFAQGGEALFKSSEDSRGALYGYRIRENATRQQRWTVLGSYYQTLVSSYSVQGRLQAQSDPEVNNHYMRSNAFRVTPELINSGALVRTTALTTTRISYSRQDVRFGEQNRFIRQTESTPRVDFRTAPLPIPHLPALMTFDAFAENSFDRARGYQQKALGAGTRLTRSFRLRRGLSLTPHAALREVFEDRRTIYADFSSTRTIKNPFTGFYEFGGNLRIDTPAGDWDAGYVFERRLKPDKVHGDIGAPDYGQVQNLMSIQDTIRPNRRVLVRVKSGYDLRRHREYNLGFRRRMQPFTSDLVYLPKSGLQFSLRNDYQLEDGNRSFLLQADWGDRDSTFAAFGVTYALDRPREYLSALEGGWKPPDSSWKFGAALRSLVRKEDRLKFHGFELFEKELSIHKDFHDFLTRLVVRFRPGNVAEITFRLDLRTDRETVRRAVRKAWEKEWFPWRRGESDERD